MCHGLPASGQWGLNVDALPAHHPIQPYQAKSAFSNDAELLIPTPKRWIVMLAVRRRCKGLSEVSYRSEDSDLHM